jgi:uncharacterized membrane protein
MMDREKAEVYVLMGNFIAKMFLVITNVILLFAVTSFMIWAAVNNGSWKRELIFGALDGVLAHTSYQMMKHFFPAAGRGDRKPPKNKTKPN